MKRSTPDVSRVKPSSGTLAPLVPALFVSAALGLPLGAQDAPAPSSPNPEPVQERPGASPQEAGQPSAPQPGGALRFERSVSHTAQGDASASAAAEERVVEERVEAHIEEHLVLEGLGPHVVEGEDGFVFMVLRKAPGAGGFVFESIDVDLSPAALEAGLGRSDLDEREAFLDDLVTRLAVRDDASAAAKRWLRAKATGSGELAWTARTALRELDHRGALFGSGGGGAELDPLIHVLGTGPSAPVLHVGSEPNSSAMWPGEPTLRAFLTRTDGQSPSAGSSSTWRFVSGAPGVLGDAPHGGLPAYPSAATQGLEAAAASGLPAEPKTDRGAALPLLGSEGTRPLDRLPGRELRAGVLVERERVNVFPVADLDAFEDYTLELQCGPGSVKLRVLEVPEARPTGAPGEQRYTAQVREYHATSLPGLLERHPELSGVLPFGSPVAAPTERLPRPDVLGVYVQAVGPDEAVELMTEAGELVHAGMRVVRVQPGTIAESMGVASGSLILEVAGYPIIDGQAISRALEQARSDAEAGAGTGAIEVEWRDPWGRRQSRVWRGQLAR